ncbi:MAG: hypothetical protein K2O00_08965 [Muribaculaceae bacterium]|nr:hypothetical protein [Muribaculaceae bacterium]
MLTFIGYIIQLMIKPQRGWEDLAKADFSARRLLVSGLIPLILLTAAVSFVRISYFSDYTWVDALQDAVINAVTFFGTYFIATFLLSLRLPYMQTEPGDSAENNNKVDIFSAGIVGILLLITLVSNLIPLDISLLQYLPLYSAYVIWKGAPYLGIAKENIGQFMIIAVASLIIPVYALGYFFHLFT